MCTHAASDFALSPMLSALFGRCNAANPALFSVEIIGPGEK
jgi:hypothetical protein